MSKTIRFEDSAYLKAVKNTSFENEKKIHEHVKANPRFSYGSVTLKEFSNYYDSTGWIGRKITALPNAIIIGTIGTTLHVALIILKGLPPLLSKNGTPLKGRVYAAGRNLQKALGYLVIFFTKDKWGMYHIQSANFHKTCYKVYTYPDTRVDSPKTIKIKKIIKNMAVECSKSGDPIASRVRMPSLKRIHFKKDIEFRSKLFRNIDKDFEENFEVYSVHISALLSKMKVGLERGFVNKNSLAVSSLEEACDIVFEELLKRVSEDNKAEMAIASLQFLLKYFFEGEKRNKYYEKLSDIYYELSLESTPFIYKAHEAAEKITDKTMRTQTIDHLIDKMKKRGFDYRSDNKKYYTCSSKSKQSDIEKYYEILGVDKSAPREEILKAWKQLMRKYHPDKQRNKSPEEKKQAEEMAKEINRAKTEIDKLFN